MYVAAGQAYRNAPEEFLHVLSQLINAENGSPGLSNLCILRRLRDCWDTRLCSLLLEKARDTSLKPWAFGDLLEHLLEHEPGHGSGLAASMIPTPLPSSGREREIATHAAISLLLLANDGGWDAVWPAIQCDTVFGRSVLESVACDYRQDNPGRLADRLREDQLADLFVWLEQQYPQVDDPPFEGGFVQPRTGVAIFRQGIIEQLKGRGTTEAARKVRHIANKFPQYTWLNRIALAAEDIARRRTWSPPAASEVIELCAGARPRLVRNVDELHDLLVEVLREIDADLQGETPSAPDLWNQSNGSHGSIAARPKGENDFSDWTKRNLDSKLRGRGIISKREVQIRRGQGTGTTRGRGENTDIYVTASVPSSSADTRETISVIIESKGCWHSELQTAMRTQLVERYLKDHNCRNGIYLVGWFRCRQWDEGDRRNKSSPDWTVTQAREFFEKQAAELSADGLSISAVVLNTALR